MIVRVTHTLDDLAADAFRAASKPKVDAAKVVRSHAIEGNRLAKSNAKRSSGTHGKHYPNAFTEEAITPLRWEFGPEVGPPQGGMSFEEGSRNQPPHRDIARAFDVIAPKFGDAVRDLPEGWFW